MNSDYENFKDQVRASADIVDVISSYLSLKKKGQNFWACCPFHGEKTPSFSVSPAKQMFYCFGCHEGGDVFKFVMKAENIGFMDSLKLLAGRYNIPVPEQHKTAEEIRQEERKERIYEANAMAARFFRACLLSPVYGKNALDYLKGRGIADATMEGFMLGYAPDNFSALVPSLHKKGFPAELLFAAGLAAKSGSRYYDKFRNRVMIPIRDARGRIVGFGGRVLGSGTPKYLNTSETEWFNKRRLLFGMDIAWKAMRSAKQAIVVEGYMDAISLHAAGIANVVASMGTALSEEQVKLLRRSAEEVVLCYDSDDPGRAASVRAVSMLRKAGLKVRVAAVPDGKDPDEYVLEWGREAFLGEVIARAEEGVAFQVSETIRENNVADLAGKVNVVSKVLPFLLECKNEIEVGAHIRDLAQRLVIDEGLITAEYRKAAKGTKGGGSAAPVARKVTEAVKKAETYLLAILAEEPDEWGRCDQVVAQTGFSRPELAEIYAALTKLAAAGAYSVAAVNDELSDSAQSVWAGILNVPLAEKGMRRDTLAAEESIRKSLGQKLDVCLRQMQRSFFEREYEKHRLLADQYERLQDARFRDELAECQRIKHEINKLYGKQQ